MLRTQSDLRSHIRTNTTWENIHGVPYKSIRELVPQGIELTPMIEELEREGQILILRSLTGKLKDAPLPELGRENAWGERLNAGGPERWRTIFWDDLKERNRTAARVEDGENAARGVADRQSLSLRGRMSGLRRRMMWRSCWKGVSLLEALGRALLTQNSSLFNLRVALTSHCRGPQGQLGRRVRRQEGQGAREEEEEEQTYAQDYKLAHEGLCEWTLMTPAVASVKKLQSLPLAHSPLC